MKITSPVINFDLIKKFIALTMSDGFPNLSSRLSFLRVSLSKVPRFSIMPGAMPLTLVTGAPSCANAFVISRSNF